MVQSITLEPSLTVVLWIRIAVYSHDLGFFLTLSPTVDSGNVVGDTKFDFPVGKRQGTLNPSRDNDEASTAEGSWEINSKQNKTTFVSALLL